MPKKKNKITRNRNVCIFIMIRDTFKSFESFKSFSSFFFLRFFFCDWKVCNHYPPILTLASLMLGEFLQPKINQILTFFQKVVVHKRLRTIELENK